MRFLWFWFKWSVLGVRGKTSAHDVWCAFECHGCWTVFDVRLFAPPTIAFCPKCKEPCELEATWRDDDGGYGSRGAFS